MKELRQITVIGLGLLGGSIALAIKRAYPSVKTTGYTHRVVTRNKARKLGVADEVTGDIAESVKSADIVVLATPISTFEEIFSRIGKAMPAGCVVTDVGSTKVLPHRWAVKKLPKTIYYAGSHPVAGSEQRGVEFARDDLLMGASCIITKTAKTNRQAVGMLKRFWSKLGCCVKVMSPAEHDSTFAKISHLPHIVAASMVNANSGEMLKFAGQGFIDSSRIASGPANIWADILLTNSKNSIRGIDKIITELRKVQNAIENKDRKRIERVLEAARSKRATMIKYKMRKKELIL